MDESTAFVGEVEKEFWDLLSGKGPESSACASGRYDRPKAGNLTIWKIEASQGGVAEGTGSKEGGEVGGASSARAARYGSRQARRFRSKAIGLERGNWSGGELKQGAHCREILGLRENALQGAVGESELCAFLAKFEDFLVLRKSMSAATGVDEEWVHRFLDGGHDLGEHVVDRQVGGGAALGVGGHWGQSRWERTLQRSGQVSGQDGRKKHVDRQN